MAIFEKQITNKVTIDDTEKLCCVIENAHNINKHTEYAIRVQRGPTKEGSWCVWRRYNDFTFLHSALQQSDIALPLPPKKIIGNMQPGFIAERQVALQAYLDEILKNNILASSFPVKMFLDPENYSLTLNEMALQNVSLALRGDGTFQMKNSLPGIGWRFRKHYFIVNKCQGSSENYLMSWLTYGPDKYLTERDLQVVFKSLMNIENPYIDKIVYMHSLEAGAYVIRKIHPNGTIKDLLYNTQHGTQYLAKYANPKQRKPFTVGQVAHYGHQILQALKYLHDSGLPYGHLHTGNIAIENQNVMLMDIENGLLGVPCIYRQYILELKKINTMESIDVYCFGHTLYEMAFAEPLNNSTCDHYPANAHPDLVGVLQMILSPSACKHGLPNLYTLSLLPFFTMSPSLSNGGIEKSRNHKFKIPNALKEEMKKAVTCIETRLKSEQKLVRAERRQLRIQEILSSEEELRKRKRKMKSKENAMSNSHSSLNGITQNGLSPLSMSGPSERSGSVASTLSTASSPTPPQINEESTSVTTPPKPPLSETNVGSSRSAFLDSICSFNKKQLKTVNK